MQWLVWQGGPAEYYKKIYIISEEIFMKGFCSWFVLLTFHAFYYNCPPVQYLALMQSNLYAWLLQSCKVFLWDFLHMTTYMWSPRQVDCSIHLVRTACWCNISLRWRATCRGNCCQWPARGYWVIVQGLAAPCVLGPYYQTGRAGWALPTWLVVRVRWAITIGP